MLWCLWTGGDVYPYGAAAARADEGAGGAPASDAPHSLFRPLPDARLQAIDTDRPHRTDTPHAVPPGHFQLESGVSLELTRLRAGPALSVDLFENSYKVGLLRGVDLEFLHTIGNLVRARDPQTQRDALSVHAGDTATLRSKINLLGTGVSGVALAFVPGLLIPLSMQQSVGGAGALFFGADLPARFELELNLGVAAVRVPGATSPTVTWTLSSALTRELNPFVSAFAEVYAEGQQADVVSWSVTIDSGLLFRVTRDVQLDAGIFAGAWGAVPALTVFAGYSIRL